MIIAHKNTDRQTGRERKRRRGRGGVRREIDIQTHTEVDRQHAGTETDTESGRQIERTSKVPVRLRLKRDVRDITDTGVCRWQTV